MAPRRMASAALAASSASSAMGVPSLSMEQPPMRWSWNSNLRSGLSFSMALSTLMPSAITSGPQWSPANTTMLKLVMVIALGSI
jgi:hypothetical protein